MRRHKLAASTWSGMVDRPFVGERNASTELAYPRDLPFVKDMIDCGGQVMLTNSDTCLIDGTVEAVCELLKTHGAVFAHRWDFQRLSTPMDNVEHARWYPGSDLFAVTPKWWKKHRNECPDLLLGAEFVDCILRQLVKKYDGAELMKCIYHERHNSAWEGSNRLTDAANCWNRKLALKWFSDNGTNEDDPSEWQAQHRYLLP